MVSASITYTTPATNQFGKLFNVPTTTISGGAKASATMPTYVGVYMALDISQSMGLGATQDDMTKLQNLTSALYPGNKNLSGCAFGCHVKETGQSISNEDLAHGASPKITLRIDSLRSAVVKNISNAITAENGKNLYKIGIYTMGSQQNNVSPLVNSSTISIGLNTLVRVTTDLAAVQTAANGIDLGSNNSNGYGDSNFSNALVIGTNLNPTPFNSLVPASGNGLSMSEAKNYAMIITDGLTDYYDTNSKDGHHTAAFDPAWCASLKAKGVIVQVLYTTYIPFPKEQTYIDLAQKYADLDTSGSTAGTSQISRNLKACASPGNFYEASDTASINSAMKAMFAEATRPSALTN